MIRGSLVMWEWTIRGSQSLCRVWLHSASSWSSSFPESIHEASLVASTPSGDDCDEEASRKIWQTFVAVDINLCTGSLVSRRPTIQSVSK